MIEHQYKKAAQGKISSQQPSFIKGKSAKDNTHVWTKKRKPSTKLQEQAADVKKSKTDIVQNFPQAAEENAEVDIRQLREELKIANRRLAKAEKDLQEKSKECDLLREELRGLRTGTETEFQQLAKAEKDFQEKSKECDLLREELKDLRTGAKAKDQQKRICVMCINQQRLQPITGAFNNMKIQRKIPHDVIIIEKKLLGTLSVHEAEFEGAKMVVLVAIPEPRNMLISNSEPSQLGVIYREAVKLGKDVFMVYTDDKYRYSDRLKDS